MYNSTTLYDDHVLASLDLTGLALVIGAIGGFIATVSTLRMQMRRDRAESKHEHWETAAAVQQVHALVNSSLTAAIQETLNTKLAVLTLLLEKDPNDPAVATAIAATKAKVVELNATILERETQQTNANKVEGQ